MTCLYAGSDITKMSNPCTKRYRFIPMIRHELTKRSIKPSRNLIAYTTTHIAPEKTRCMIVTSFPFLNRLDREAEKVNQINSWRTNDLNQKCYLSVIAPKPTRFPSRQVLVKIVNRQKSNSELATVVTWFKCQTRARRGIGLSSWSGMD